MEEVWKDIKGYEGIYMVSNKGRIKSLERKIETRNRWGKMERRFPGKIIKPSICKRTGYYNVVLNNSDGGKTFKVHRLVAIAFVENKNNLPQVNHKDENKINNCVENLEWCTAKYNSNYGTKTKRAAKAQSKKVAKMKNGGIIEIYDSLHDVTRKTGISFKNVCSVCNGLRKTAGGYEWKYI